MPAWRWPPSSPTGAGVLLLQEIFGVSGYIKRRAAALAEAGYEVLAPELYWRLDPSLPPIDESAPDALETAMRRVSALDWGQAVADSTAAFGALESSGGVERAGVMGFCLGGGLAFNVAAETEPACLVSYYGSALPGLLELAPQVDAPSLHHFGLADDYIDAATVDRIREAVTAHRAEVEFETYEGANHAFDNDDFMNFHPKASRLAWERTLDFLRRRLQTG
jgi:carboxymethylenebutenolidase